MALWKFNSPAGSLSQTELEAWQHVPTTIASDELNRAAAMDAGIRPVTANGRMVGLATTVRVAAGDNLALHHAVSEIGEGRVLMVDAGGYDRAAVWGGILHKAAAMRGYCGVVIDGCIRDLTEIAASPLSCYARGIVAAGPQKGWGGEINATVQIGGAIVRPGDIVIGDEDGVAVIPYLDRATILEGCRRRLAAEAELLRRIENGETTAAILGL